MSEKPRIILLPGLHRDVGIRLDQVEALKPYSKVFIADFSQVDSVEALAERCRR